MFFRLTTADKEQKEPEPHEILTSLHRIVTEVDSCGPSLLATQGITEYFQHLFHLPTKKNSNPPAALDGIAFRSSKYVGGIIYTLFIERKACADNRTETGAVRLLRGAKQQTISEKPEFAEDALKRILGKGT